jgi:predicted ATPase
MLREMTDALVALTLERPLLLVLEDLHWADCSTLDLVAFLARPREPARLLIVGTSQPLVSLPGTHPLRAIRRELTIHRRSVELPLAPFAPAAVASYLHARLENGWWPAGLVEWIHEWTEGNPLYVTSLIDELVRRRILVPRGGAWTMTGAIEDVEVQVPDLVRELTAMALEGLDDFDRRILEVASVAGREFAAADVADALEEDVQTIEERCELLVRRQQCLSAAGPSHFRFLHAFAQQVLSQQIPPRLRARLRHRVRQRR